MTPRSARYSVCDKQLHEGGMRDVVGLRAEHQLGIRGDVDLARAAAVIGNRDAPDLGIVLGRDEHFQRRRQGAVAPGVFGTVLVEHGVIAIGFGAAWLEAGRPHVAALRRPGGR